MPSRAQDADRFSFNVGRLGYFVTEHNNDNNNWTPTQVMMDKMCLGDKEGVIDCSHLLPVGVWVGASTLKETSLYEWGTQETWLWAGAIARALSRKRQGSSLLLQLCVCVCVFSCVLFFVTPWAVAHQAPLSMGFSRQEYWSELPFPRPGDLPDLGTEPVSLTSPLQANSLPPATGEASCQFKTPGGQAREAGLVLSALLVFGFFFF